MIMMYKMDSALNKLHWLRCHKTKQNRTILFFLVCFLNSLARSMFQFIFLFWPFFPLLFSWKAKYTKQRVIFHVYKVIHLYLKIPGILSVSLSLTDSDLCIHHLVVWSYLSFLHTSQWITFPTQSCSALQSIRCSLLHSLTMWLIVFSSSLHNLILQYFSLLPIYALT